MSAVYFLTYLGDSTSNDGLLLFDSTESWVNHGVLDINYHYDNFSDYGTTPQDPIPPSLYEPLQPILASPLYLVAQTFPPLGMFHTVYLFNVLVTALTATILFLALAREHPPTVALSLALVFGLTTIVWPYSRTFFREPLAGMGLLLAFLAARSESRRVQIIGLTVTVGALLLTKSALIAAIPGLVWIALPHLSRRSALTVIVLAALGVAGLFAVGEVLDIARFTLTYWRGFIRLLEWRYIAESLLGYTLSPGRSVFWFSPVLLLALYGSVLLWRRGDARLVVGVWLAFFGVVLSYGGQGGLWWGGNSWGPRHLVPLTALLFWLSVPALLGLWRHRRGRYALVALIAVSIGVQLLGSLVSIYAHYQHLAENGVLVWEGGLWSWRWSPIPMHLALLDFRAFDIAWREGTDAPFSVILLAMAVIALTGITWRARAGERQIVALILPPLLIVTFAHGLYLLRDDPRLIAGNQDALPLVDMLEAVSTPDEPILLQNVSLRRPFMNQFRPQNWVFTLPYLPGENYDPARDPADWRTADPAALLDAYTPRLLTYLIAHVPRLWIVVDADPANPDELRALERTLLKRAFPVLTITQSQYTRAILFDTRPLPATIPTLEEPRTFGDAMTLDGFSLPYGNTFHAGAVVPIALNWRIPADLREDLLVSVQIAAPDAPPVAQYDGLPEFGFGRTGLWTPETAYPDYYGLRLPDDLPAGTYNVQVIVYRYPSLERLTLADGETVAVLSAIVVE